MGPRREYHGNNYTGYRGFKRWQSAMLLALQAIKAPGDSYDVLTQQDDPITAIYWLIDGTD
jgi:hypothetical protein